MAAIMVPCTEHGESAWCYVQGWGEHVDSEECVCLLSPSTSCPVDAHCHEAESRINEYEMWGPKGRPF